MSGLGLIYKAINAAADGLSMPRQYAWFILAMIGAGIVGLILYIVGRNSIVLGFIGLILSLVIQWFQNITPFSVVFLAIVIPISAFLVHRRETG